MVLTVPDPLASLLAEAIASQFGDAVAVLHVGRADGRARSRAVEHVWVEASALEAAIPARRERAVVLVDRHGGRPHEVVPAREGFVPRRLGAVLLSGLRRHVRRTARAVPYEEIVPFAPRLALPAGELPVTLDALPAASREGFLRWARAATGRQVGVALGGGGAWGFGSVAVLEALLARGVPVDMVAGSSSGALVGAWYGAFGPEGLERFVARGRDLERALPLMTLTTRPAEWLVDADLGGARLEELERPVLAVATDVRRLRPVVFVEGSVAFAARASVSAPGVFAPTVGEDGELVDGAVIDNAPYRPLEAAGAGLVVVANPLPAQVPGRPGLRFSPLSRARSFAEAFALVSHAAGNPEPRDRRIVYRARPTPDALRRIFRYADAERFLDVARRDPALEDAVSAAAFAWRDLARGRGGPRHGAHFHSSLLENT